MSSKAQGLSLNAMVLAGLGLIVLAVLVALFSGSFGGFGTKLSQGGEQECRDGVNGFKQMPGSCGEEGPYLYTQYFGNFKQGSVADGKVCCKSECESAGGICNNSPCSLGKGLVSGNSGCPSGNSYCCKH